MKKKGIDEIDLMLGVLAIMGLYYLALGVYMIFDWYKIGG